MFDDLTFNHIAFLLVVFGVIYLLLRVFDLLQKSLPADALKPFQDLIKEAGDRITKEWDKLETTVKQSPRTEDDIAYALVDIPMEALKREIARREGVPTMKYPNQGVSVSVGGTGVNFDIDPDPKG